MNRPLVLLLLLAAIAALAGNHHRHHHRARRDNDLHNWLTAEQKEALKDVPKGTIEFKEKVAVYYNELPEEKRAEWDAFYKKHCFEWTAKVQTPEQETEFQTFVTENNKEKVKERVGELKQKLDEASKKNVEMWEEDCYKLVSPKRLRREIEPAFQEFVRWMTPDQLGDIAELKKSGKGSEVHAKVKEFFGLLPADQQSSLKEEFKGKCKVYFGPLMTPDELEKIKTLKGDKAAAGALVKAVVDRQDGEVKATAEKMLALCGEVYKDSRKRREIEAAFQEFVRWMTPEQLGDIAELKKSGKEAEVHGKVKEFFALLPTDQQSSLKQEFKGKCKGYFSPLMTPDELEKIETLKENKVAAGALVKAVVDRQEGEIKATAEKMFAVCGEVYKESRMRRSIEPAFQDFVKWMTPEQLGDISALKVAGKEDEVQAKVKEYFGQLPADQQASLKVQFKGSCKKYFLPLMTPEEVDQLESLKEDQAAAGALVKAVVNRQVGDVKDIAGKMFGVCGEVYKTSRKRREIEAAFQEFVKWMTPEQLGDIAELKKAGNEANVHAKVKEFFGLLPDDQQSSLLTEFKGKCKVHFTPLMTPEELEKIETLKGDQAAAAALVRAVVDRQDGEVKVVAEKMFHVCGEVYKEKSRKRRNIEAPFQDFAKWMTPEQLGDIAELKKSGKESEVASKVKGFFAELPRDRQASLKDEFKGKCRTHFHPLMTPEELDKIQTLKTTDKAAAAALIKDVVDRQVGDVKKIAEKMFEICGEVYKESRKRRNIEPAFEEFVKWMTPEQLGDIAELKKSGKESQVHSKVKEFFGLLPASQQSSLKEEFKGKCKVYFTPLMTPEELEQIQALKTSDKEAAGALVKAVVHRQEGEIKATAEKMLALCTEVYKESSRFRREIEAVFQDFVKWMTPEQLAEITGLKAAGKETAVVQDKVKELFEKLPADQQVSLKKDFKGKCKTFFGPLMTAEELDKIKTLTEDQQAAGALVKQVVDRQMGDVKIAAEKMLGVCGEVYKDSSRRRREIEPAFQDFVKWMTPEQLGDIAELKKSGKEDEVQAKVFGYFDKLPVDQQATLKEEFKGKCKVYFGPLMTSEENDKVKELAASGDKAAIGPLVKAVVDRQDGEIKKIAEKMFSVCGAVYKETKSKRDVSVASKIEKHLSWLQPAEKEEILQMSKDGKSKDDIKKRLLEIVEAKEKNADEKAKTVKLCYAWMDEVATKEEVENLHNLHHVDHGACKKKVREFIGRLPAEKQQAVEASLPFCEKLWYGDHTAHQDHSGHSGHEGHAHHHRRRRHLAVIEKYVQWLDGSQKEAIDALESSGAEFTVIADKIKEYFHLLPEEKQTDVKDKFQHQCMIWAKEVSKPLEWEEIKKLHASGDHKALKLKLVELEERLTENQKHTIEHVRGVCYRLWGIKDVARRRRVVQESFDEKAAKYLDWLNEEQLGELKRLKDEGKKAEVMKAILKFFDATSGGQKTSAEAKLKEACRDYSLKIFGAEKVGELKKLAEQKVDKAEMEKVADGYVEEIQDAAEKEKAKAVVAGCKHVYGSSRSRRELIAREVAEYLEN